MKKLLMLAAALWAAALPARAEDWRGAAGAKSGISAFEKVEVRDEKTWLELWKRHDASAQAPKVDFSKESVVAVFLGQRPSSGYRVELTAEGRPLTVVYKETKPAADAVVLTVITSPFAMIKVAKQAEPARFTESASRAKAGAKAQKAVEGILTPMAIGFRDAVSAGFDGAKLRAPVPAPQGCTPGVDCPQEPAKKPSKAKQDCTPGVDCPSGGNGGGSRRPSCTPGVDCPQDGSGGRRTPSCTPGVDCPNDGGRRNPSCTPGVDCPGNGGGNNGGRTPLPPNYRPRPSAPPDRWDIPADPRRWDTRVDSAGWWHLYRDIFGQTRDITGGWYQSDDSASIKRGGAETRLGEHAAYQATLTVTPKRNIHRLHWRWEGYNCDPYDGSRCEQWSIGYAYFLDEVQSGRSSAANVTVVFANNPQQALLPWETERLTIGFDGLRPSLTVHEAGFEYAQNGPVLDPQSGRFVFTLVPTRKRLNNPESDKVDARLQLAGGQVQLVLTDHRTSYYAGESLEIAMKIQWDKPWSANNPVIYEKTAGAPLVIKVDPSNPTTVINLEKARKNGYWIDGWSFRRANSRISGSAWQNKGSQKQVDVK